MKLLRGGAAASLTLIVFLSLITFVGHTQSGPSSLDGFNDESANVERRIETQFRAVPSQASAR